MSDEKGRRFLELIDEQNGLQSGIVAKVSALIASGWGSDRLKDELAGMASRHAEITRELNGLDDA